MPPDNQPKWFKKDKSIKQIANEKEKKVYKSLQSGALSMKADFNTLSDTIDLKSTEKSSIRITQGMCDKLIKDSLSNGKENSFFILDLPNYQIVCKVLKKFDK